MFNNWFKTHIKFQHFRRTVTFYRSQVQYISGVIAVYAFLWQFRKNIFWLIALFAFRSTVTVHRNGLKSLIIKGAPDVNEARAFYI